MAAGLPDLVDCTRLAEDAAVLQRVYEFSELPRVKDLLAEPLGTLSASFAFGKLATGRAGAAVRITAIPQLTCQRCMQGFGLNLSGGSEIEFAASEEPDTGDSERELFVASNGLVSLRQLAEEELLLALPLAPACSTPLTCGKAPAYVTGDERPDAAGDMRRPFSALQDLLKKT
jgi:uncharacterized metal-binding protein YceD (DUF177 family)